MLELVTAIERHVRRDGERTAVVSSGATLSYAELLDRARRAARWADSRACRKV